MLRKDIIEPSESSYSAPVVLIRKKDESVRFCIDFRKLNFITAIDAEPIPDQHNLLYAQANNKFFSKIDLTSAYWHVPL